MRSLARVAVRQDARRASPQYVDLVRRDVQDESQLVVFARPTGRPIDRHAWKALLKRSGVGDDRLHDGRHTAATLLLSAGVHPRVVMELLGHSQMRMTTDTYQHVMPALAQEAAERMGDTLWG